MELRGQAREYLTAMLFLVTLAAGTVLWLWGLLVPEGDYAGMQSLSKADMLDQAFATAPASRPAPTPAAPAQTAEPLTPAEGLELLAEEADPTINTALDRSHTFIQLFGGTQRLLGRRILEDVEEDYTVYKLSDGTLTFVNPEPGENIASHAVSYLRFQAALKEKGIPLLYLQAPQKIGGEGTPALPEGVSDYGNENADQFLSLITRGNASTLDLREVLAQDGDLWTSYFFATDHHWTPEAAMLCLQELVEHLNENYDMDLDPALTDPAQYTPTVYEDIFLGSQGKRTGSLYAGMDDITVWTPNFETDFTHTIQVQVHEGSFEECLLFPEHLEEEDPFQGNPYTVYSGGDYSFSRIINHLNPDGPRIMILRDSYACVFTPFLAMHCSDLAIVDLRYFYANFPTYIDWLDPDLVLMLYTPGNLTNEMAFNFFSVPIEETAEEKTAAE